MIYITVFFVGVIGAMLGALGATVCLFLMLAAEAKPKRKYRTDYRVPPRS